MRSGRLLGMLDDNLDGKVEMSEIRGRTPNAMIKPRFAQIDTNKDNVLDGAELKAAAAMLPGFGPRRPQQTAASGSSSN
jgi:hypothetical protein